MDGPLDARLLAEKLAPPRALLRLPGALYAPPLEGGSVAWLAWLDTRDDDVLRGVIARAHADRARTLGACGPPGNYIASGVDLRDTVTCAWLEARGFRVRHRHLELVVDTGGHHTCGAVIRCRDRSVLDAVARTFSCAWALEAERSLAHDGLFVARTPDNALAGIAAHSGNRAYLGTFGPIGVTATSRGTGLGRALASTALADLAARGFATATVHWIDDDARGFYHRLCRVRTEAWRAEYRLDLHTNERG